MRFSNLLCLLLAAMLVLAAQSASAGVPRDAVALPEGEMAALCGGFSLNGFNLAVGIDNRVSLNNQVIASSTLNVAGGTVTSSSSTVTVQGANGGATTVSLTPTLSILANTANNVTLAQQRTITVDIPNYVRNNIQMASSLAVLRTQALTSMKNGLH